MSETTKDRSPGLLAELRAAQYTSSDTWRDEARALQLQNSSLKAQIGQIAQERDKLLEKKRDFTNGSEVIAGQAIRIRSWRRNWPGGSWSVTHSRML
jgi:hypothetical protein